MGGRPPLPCAFRCDMLYLICCFCKKCRDPPEMDEAIRRTRRGITVKLEMTQKQELKLTPQMLQSMEILQMSTQELEAYLQELVQENPAAELSEPEERPGRGGGAVAAGCSRWPTRTTRTGSTSRRSGRSWIRWPGSGRTAGWRTPFCSTCPGSWSAARPPPCAPGSPILAACLDEAGYLREKVENLAQAAGTARRGAGGGAEPAPDAGPGGRGRA